MRIEDEAAKDATERRTDAIKQVQAELEQQDQQRRIETEDVRVRQDGLTTERNAQAFVDELSGAELHAEAVDAASAQQDRGEAWMSFRDQEQTPLPQSVEEVAQHEKQDAADAQQQQERISVQALMNQHKINNGIPS